MRKFIEARPDDGQPIEVRMLDGEWYAGKYFHDGVDGIVELADSEFDVDEYPEVVWRELSRVILSTSLIVGEGTFQAQEISEVAARAWLDKGPVANYCRHETVKLLGFDPKQALPQCERYEEALCLGAKSRLEFGRHYSVEEIREIGVRFMLVKRTPSLDDILALAAKLPSGLYDPKAADKLLAEREELLEALAEGDTVGAMTEAADAGYYAAKYLNWVGMQLGLSIGEVLLLTVAKYGLRAVPGNPKDDEAERKAILDALASLGIVLKEKDFSAGERGKFYRAGVEVVLPDEV